MNRMHKFISHMAILKRKSAPAKKSAVIAEAPPAQCFWVHNGPILRNIGELARALEHMSDDQFTHHVNSRKNDFSKWIVDVLHLSDVARDLGKATTRKTAIKALQKHVK